MHLGLGLDIMSDESKKTDMISKKMYNIESKIINAVIYGDNATIDFGENLSSEEMKEVSEIVELCGVYKEYWKLISEVSDLIENTDNIRKCEKMTIRAIDCWNKIVSNDKYKQLKEILIADNNTLVRLLDEVISKELAIDDQSKVFLHIDKLSKDSEKLACMMGSYLKELISNVDDRSQAYINVKKKINSMSDYALFDINIYRLSLFMDCNSEYYEKYDKIFNDYVNKLNNNIADIKEFGVDLSSRRDNIIDIMNKYLSAKKKILTHQVGIITITGLSLVFLLCRLSKNYQKITTESLVNNKYSVNEIYTPEGSKVYNGIYIDVYGEEVNITLGNDYDGRGIIVNRYDASELGINEIDQYDKIDMKKLNKLVDTLIVTIPECEDRDNLVKISKITSEEISLFEKEPFAYIFVVVSWCFMSYFWAAFLDNVILFKKKIRKYFDTIENTKNDIDKYIHFIDMLNEEMRDNKELMDKFREFYKNKEYIFNEIDAYKDKYDELNRWFEYEGLFELEEHNFFIKNVKKKTKIKG